MCGDPSNLRGKEGSGWHSFRVEMSPEGWGLASQGCHVEKSGRGKSSEKAQETGCIKNWVSLSCAVREQRERGAGGFCAQVVRALHAVREFGLNPEGTKEARMFHSWQLNSPNPYCAKMVFLGQVPGLAYYGHVLWTWRWQLCLSCSQSPSAWPIAEHFCGSKLITVNLNLSLAGALLP